MKQLTIRELQEILSRNSFLRMEDIPLETGLVVDDRFMLIPTAEGELTGIDLQGIHEIFYHE